MKIEIEFIGFPTIYDLFPAGAHPYSFTGRTVLHLVEDLLAGNGQRLAESFLDPGTKKMDPTIQVRLNGKFVLKEEIGGREITEGDQVTFLKLLAGG